MIYLSDHGDDADKHLGHESSKFTYRMAHIPLIMLFSESFMQNRRELYETLKSHKDSYWTNDLLYNVMVNILGCKGYRILSPYWIWEMRSMVVVQIFL